MKCQLGLFFSGIVVILMAGIGFISILLETVGIRDIYEWNKMEIFIVLFIASCFSFKNNVYQFLLLRHIRFLNQNTEVFVEWEFNTNLQKIIKQLNQPIHSIFLVSSAGILTTGAISSLLLGSQFVYWNYFKVPLVLYTFYFLYHFWEIYKQLIENLIQVEIAHN